MLCRHRGSHVMDSIFGHMAQGSVGMHGFVLAIHVVELFPGGPSVAGWSFAHRERGPPTFPLGRNPMRKQKGRIDGLKCVCASSNTDFIYANFGRVSNRLYFMKGKHLLSVDFPESASDADIRKAIWKRRRESFSPLTAKMTWSRID